MAQAKDNFLIIGAAADGVLLSPTESEPREQARINAHVHRGVIPKLRDCWRKLQGRGGISFRQSYVNAEGRWVPETNEHLGIELDDSKLALCMRQAVDGTSWPVDSSQSEAPTYVLLSVDPPEAECARWISLVALLTAEPHAAA
jgi:hypothetical protein